MRTVPACAIGLALAGASVAWAKGLPGRVDPDVFAGLFVMATSFGLLVWPLAVGMLLGIARLFRVRLSARQAAWTIAAGPLATLAFVTLLIVAGALIGLLVPQEVDVPDNLLFALSYAPAAVSVVGSLLALIFCRDRKKDYAPAES